jgi:hypothetical protein
VTAEDLARDLALLGLMFASRTRARALRRVRPPVPGWADVESAGGTPPQIASHPIAFGSGEWTRVVGEFEGRGHMVTVAKWRDGAIAAEYIWP